MVVNVQTRVQIEKMEHILLLTRETRKTKKQQNKRTSEGEFFFLLQMLTAELAGGVVSQVKTLVQSA
jgi:hypothetical protein